MESTGSERRGLIILLSIIGLLIIAAIVSGTRSRTDRSAAMTYPESSVRIHKIKSRQSPDSGNVKKNRRRAKTTKDKSEREYRQRDFYGETVDN